LRVTAAHDFPEKDPKAPKKSIARRIFTNLTFWVLIAIIVGVLIGHFAPETGKKMDVIGKYFVEIIKLFIPPIIFLTIVLGISGMGDLKKVGRIGVKALLYFEVVTTFALVIGIVMAYWIQPGAIDRTTLKAGDTAALPSAAKEFSWLQFFLDNLTLQILLAAIIAGIALHFYGRRELVLTRLNWVSKKVFLCLKYVMYLAPLGALGGMASVVGKYGLHTLLPLAKLMGTVYLTMFLFIFCILGGILWIYRIKIWKLLAYIKEELLIVLGTSSSESALPNIMLKLERLGCSKSVVGLVIPTGYSFNLDLPLHVGDLFGATLQGGPEHGRIVVHHRHPHDHLQGGCGCDGKRIYRAGIDAHGHRQDSCRGTGLSLGCRQVHERGPRHHQPHRQLRGHDRDLQE
jgi:aerobic C4-dicarboxylate transport protein